MTTISLSDCQWQNVRQLFYLWPGCWGKYSGLRTATAAPDLSVRTVNIASPSLSAGLLRLCPCQRCSLVFADTVAVSRRVSQCNVRQYHMAKPGAIANVR